MKNTTKCPKCESTDILHIPGQVEKLGFGNNIPVGRFTTWSHVKVSRFLCVNCGFSEEWVVDKEGMQRLKKKYGNAP
jgi:Zn ribbon nucleic-acid-binding protein